MSKAQAEMIDYLKAEVERLRQEVGDKDRQLYEVNDKFIKATIEIHAGYARAFGEMGPKYEMHGEPWPDRFSAQTGTNGGQTEMKIVDLDQQELHDEQVEQDEETE